MNTTERHPLTPPALAHIPLALVAAALVALASALQLAVVPVLAQAPAPIEIRARADRTAAWIGERVSYVVELRAGAGVDVLVDDLAREAVKVEGGEVVDVEAQRDEHVGRVTHRVRYTLVTYRVDVTEMVMAALPVRYAVRAAGLGASDSAPAGQVMVPPLRVAVRSAIPETRGELAARTPAGLRPVPRWLRFAEPVGLGLILVGIVPVIFGSLDLVRRARAVAASWQSRRSRNKQRGSFDQIRALDPASDAARIEAFGQLDTFVKDHLRVTTGVEAHALTPDEIRHVLEQQAPALPHEAIGTVLAACERVRYDAAAPTAAEWDETLRTSEQALAAAGR